MNHKYVLVPESKLTQEMLNHATTRGKDTARRVKKFGRKYAVLKVDGELPQWARRHRVHTHETIHRHLRDDRRLAYLLAALAAAAILGAYLCFL